MNRLCSINLIDRQNSKHFFVCEKSKQVSWPRVMCEALLQEEIPQYSMVLWCSGTGGLWPHFVGASKMKINQMYDSRLKVWTRSGNISAYFGIFFWRIIWLLGFWAFERWSFARAKSNTNLLSIEFHNFFVSKYSSVAKIP
jgi:hypothetical protein